MPPTPKNQSSSDALPPVEEVVIEEIVEEKAPEVENRSSTTNFTNDDLVKLQESQRFLAGAKANGMRTDPHLLAYHSQRADKLTTKMKNDRNPNTQPPE